MRNPTALELITSDKYKILYELDHVDLVKFLQRNLRKWSLVTLFYLLANLGALALVGISMYRERVATWDSIFSGFSLGLFVAFSILVVIHESIHLLAYKLLGAKQAVVKAQWRKLVFMAMADQFVLNRREFYFLALLPFVVITPALLLGLSFVSGYWYYLILGALLMHTAGCSGDFALVGYFYENNDRAIFTFDDVAAGKSYFCTAAG